MKRRHQTFRHGMTLLEVVLAITIIAALSGLIATMWTQASRMSADGGEHGREMRLARVLEMMRSQWADRRTSVALGKGPSAVSVDPEALTFITATAVLEPGWPIVRARYVLERDFDTGIGQAAAWRLVYEELPVVDMGSPASVPGETERRLEPGERRVERPVEAPREKRLVLLGGCTELEWERFGKGAAADEAERLRSVEPQEADGEAVLPDRSRGRPPTAEEKIAGWRGLDEPFSGHIPAVRLVGEFEDKEFACVFVIGDSR